MKDKIVILALVSIIGTFGLLAYKMKDFDAASFKSSLSTINGIIASFKSSVPSTDPKVAGIDIDPVTVGVQLQFAVTIFVLLKK